MIHQTLALGWICSLALGAQEVATTNIGERVYLYPDNSWVKFFERPATSKAKESINCGGFSLYFDSGKWASQGYDADGNLMFFNSSFASVAVVAIEKEIIPFDQLSDEIEQEMSKLGNDMEIISKDKRVVNGIDVFSVHFNMTAEGVPMTGFGYICNSSSCQTIIMAFSHADKFKRAQSSLKDFLNGLSPK